MAILTRQGGIWKDSKPMVKDGGVWKEVSEAYVKDGGVWKQVISGGRVWTVTPEAYNWSPTNQYASSAMFGYGIATPGGWEDWAYKGVRIGSVAPVDSLDGIKLLRCMSLWLNGPGNWSSTIDFETPTTLEGRPVIVNGQTTMMINGTRIDQYWTLGTHYSAGRYSVRIDRGPRSNSPHNTVVTPFYSVAWPLVPFTLILPD